MKLVNVAKQRVCQKEYHLISPMQKCHDMKSATFNITEIAFEKEPARFET